MKFLLVEDDNFDAQEIRAEIEKRLHGVIETIETEREFVERLEAIAQNPPDLIIMDVMLPWDKPRLDAEIQGVPQDVLAEGFYSAGIRCVNRLQADSRTAPIPYILYTGLERNVFPGRVIITKTASIEPLISEIRRLVNDLHSIF